MLSDSLLLGSLIGAYFTFSKLSFSNIECPEHLKPKNTKDRRTKDYFDYYGNYLSMVHAYSSLLLTAYVLLTEEFAFNAPSTFAMKVAIYNSLAYFTSDLIISVFYGYMTAPLALHHVGSIVCTLTVFIAQTGGYETAVGIFLAELSNPCNLTREVLKHFKKDKTQLYGLMSAGFIATFVIARFFVIPVFLVSLYPSNSLLIIKFMFATVWFVSWHWLFIIFNFGLKAIKDGVDAEGKADKTHPIYKIYGVASKLRKNKAFLASYYLGTAWLSFGTLYLAHGKA
jgi:hypothetical protein